jgi:hypothetical protein
MKSRAYPVGNIPYASLLEHPVWEYIPESAKRDEAWVRVVSHLPVRSMKGRIAVSFVRLANEQEILALIGNVELNDPTQNDHFLTLSVVKPSGERFDLARYHDVTYKHQGPEALAQFLDLSLNEVFPIEYDISSVAKGEPGVKGTIPVEPLGRRSQAELIALAVGNVP